MSKQVIGVVAAAVILFGAALGGALAFTGGESAGPAPDGTPATTPTPVHRMSDGSLMEGPFYEMPKQKDEQSPQTDGMPGEDEDGMMDEGGMHGGGMMDGGMGHGG